MLLIGPPGSGKGTIGKAIASLPGFAHCSSGDIIRTAAMREGKETDRWKQMGSGQLLGDSVIWEIFDAYLRTYSERVAADADDALLLIDGIPRCRSQVDELSHRVLVRSVVYLDGGDQDSLRGRLVRRFGESGRIDDFREEVIRNRVNLFYEKTLPVLECYPAEAIHRIDALQRPEAVLLDVLNCFEHIRGRAKRSKSTLVDSVITK
jgi:adenylate kinase